MSQIHQPFTSGFSRGRMRFTSLPRRTSTVVEQPRLHSPHVDAILTRFQTRAWKRNLESVSAPTGHRSAMLPWYLPVNGRSESAPSGPRNVAITEREPKSATVSCATVGISSKKRTQRLHRMQRSWSSTITSPSDLRFSSLRRGSTERPSPWPSAKE